jgi:methylthioribose-1-phosphate isomerase
MFVSMRYEADCLHLIDQRLLPHEQKWLNCHTAEDIAKAIETMVVRGAPAIATAAAYALAIDARSYIEIPTIASRFKAQIDRLAKTRPTAVNLFHVLSRFTDLSARLLADHSMTTRIFADQILSEAHKVFQEDLDTCHAIGAAGLSYARSQLSPHKRLKVLTHCNTGSLATSGYGTALGIIRSLHNAGLLEMVYVDETRPYLQGSRLTAYELAEEGIPFRLITDSMAAYVMQQHLVDWVVVGADRIVANGDTANKIGTYSLAVLANFHKVEFFVAAPWSTFDMSRKSGAEIPVEERPESEVTQFQGIAVAPHDTRAYNPSFDITPNQLISGFFTERGFWRPNESMDYGKAETPSLHSALCK